MAYVRAGRWDDSIASHRPALRLSPDRIGAHYGIGTAPLMKGEPQAALEEFAREGDEEWRVKGTAMALHGLGRRQEHEATLGGVPGARRRVSCPARRHRVLSVILKNSPL